MPPASPAPPADRVCPDAAGLATRFAAWLIDLGFCVALLLVFNVLVRPWFFESDAAGQMASAAMFFLLPVIYGWGFEWVWGGRTPGKRWLRLRVADARGGRLAAWQVAVRNVLRVVDALPQFSLLGGVACVATARAQRLGDLAARTLVVRDDDDRRPDPRAAANGGTDAAWREHPGYAARLRERIGPEAAVLALRALWRRDALDPAARAEIFGRLAERFRAAAPLPAAWQDEGLADEAFVQRVVAVLFDPNPSDQE